MSRIIGKKTDMKLEEVIEQTQIQPYDKSTAAWCQVLTAHQKKTYLNILNALIRAEQHVKGIATRNPNVDWIINDYKAIVDAIEEATNVEMKDEEEEEEGE